MKKFISGILFGAILFAPVGVLAYQEVTRPPYTNVIYQYAHDDNDSLVSVFDDGDNKCYIAVPPYVRDSKPSISCVKK